MKIKEMIELTNMGYKAKDVFALHKAGYTAEMIVELSEEPDNPATPENDPVPEKKESPSENEAINNKKEEKQEDKKEEPDLVKQELERVKKELADLQEKNRHKDNSGKEPEDPTKNIKEYIASLM